MEVIFENHNFVITAIFNDKVIGEIRYDARNEHYAFIQTGETPNQYFATKLEAMEYASETARAAH